MKYNLEIENKQVQQKVSGSAEVQPESRSNNSGVIIEQSLVIPLCFSNALAQKLALDPVLETQPKGNTGEQIGSYVSIQAYKLPTDTPEKSNFTKFEERKRYSYRIADKIAEFDYQKAEKIRSCSSKIIERQYANGTSRVFADHYCSDRYCAVCANRRTRSLIARYGQKIEQFIADKNAYHFVFTYKNMDHLLDRKQISKHLRNLFRRSIWDRYSNKQMSRKDSTHVAGVLYSIETTYNAETDKFHPHIHCLVVTDRPIKTYRKNNRHYVDHYSFKNELQETWREISSTGTDQENFVVYGEKWNKKHVTELLKYSTKLEKTSKGEKQRLSDMPAARLKEIIDWTTGHRQIAALGGLYNYTIGLEKICEQELAAEMVKDQFEKTDHVEIKKTFDHEKQRYVETGRSIAVFKLPIENQESISNRKKEKLLQRLDRLSVRIDRREQKFDENRRAVARVERSKEFSSLFVEASGKLKDKFENEAKKESYQITSLLRKRKAFENIFNAA